MVQISFKLAVQATTTISNRNATTSGPIKLPYWAPDIDWMPTTTLHDQAAGILTPETTWYELLAFNPNGGYNKRCFGTKRDDHDNDVGDVITIHYRAVGELTRT